MSTPDPLRAILMRSPSAEIVPWAQQAPQSADAFACELSQKRVVGEGAEVCGCLTERSGGWI